MKNKVSSKDYQPIKFHRGRPRHTPPGQTGQESDLNEDDALRKNDVDSLGNSTGREKASEEEKDGGDRTLVKKRTKLKGKKEPGT